jgi:hypothetical protein
MKCSILILPCSFISVPSRGDLKWMLMKFYRSSKISLRLLTFLSFHIDTTVVPDKASYAVSANQKFAIDDGFTCHHFNSCCMLTVTDIAGVKLNLFSNQAKEISIKQML